MQSLRRLMRLLSRGDDETSIVPPGTTTMETDLGVGRSSGTEEGSGKQLEAQEHGGAQNRKIGLGTPRRAGRDAAVPPSTVPRRPVTRSITRSQRASHTHKGPKTELMGKLLDASSRAVDRSTASKLEDAEDIEYIEAQDQDDGAEEYVNAGPDKSRKRKLRVSTESRDASQVGTPARSSIIAKPATRPVRSQSSRPPKRQKRLAGEAPKMPLRRSARLSKPLTQFHKYPMLPPELRIMVFEAVLSPRILYLQNRADPGQEPPPSWFMTNSISVAVAKASYQRIFGQEVNPWMDIVALEPCCGGCRGYHCANRNFSEADRNAVRLLAMQIEPYWLDTLPYIISPIWATVSMAWPNVETLYLMKEVMGGDGEEKAVLRCYEGPREASLRSRFNQWRKTAGAETNMARLEFVVLVPKERNGSMKSPLERYRHVGERATGRPEDIIVG